MPITTAVCTSFKVDLCRAIFDFTSSTGDTFNVALFTSAADLGEATSAYSTTNEVSGTGYTAGGAVLSSVTPVAVGTTAVLDFADITFPSSTITSGGCMIYNFTDSGRSVSIHSFGGDESSSNGNFTLEFPVAGATTSVVRLA